jgi:hypothetical protein
MKEVRPRKPLWQKVPLFSFFFSFFYMPVVLTPTGGVWEKHPVEKSERSELRTSLSNPSSVRIQSQQHAWFHRSSSSPTRRPVSKPAGSKERKSVPSGDVCLEVRCASIAPATPNRKCRNMNRRNGQAGSVVKKGKMWHGRYYVDLQDRRKRISMPLGPVAKFTKPEAKRKLRELLEQSGVNAEFHLFQAIQGSRTFEQESAWWRRNKLSLFKPSCQETMGSHIDKYMLPQFSGLPIDAVDERRVQEFVADLNRTELAPKSCRIHVRRSVWRGQEVTVKTKSGNRTVDIEPALAEMLLEHLNGRTAGRVFQTRNGTALSKDSVRRKLVSVLAALGLKQGGLHAFRHGRVSVLQQKGVPGDLVKEWIGHSNLRTTSRYTHFGPEIRERVAAEVGIFQPILDPNGPNFKGSNVP